MRQRGKTVRQRSGRPTLPLFGFLISYVERMDQTLKKKIVLFDFDGMIADTFDGALRVMGSFEPDITPERIRKRFEGNVNEYHVLEGKKGPTEEEDRAFFDLYTPEVLKARMFPGIAESIRELALRYVLIIVSSTISAPIREYAEARGIATYFSGVLGNEVHKSKVEKIKMVFEKYGVGPDACVFITDTLGDVREAARAGVHAIAVTWGFHEHERLAQGDPFVLASLPADLPRLVDEYFGDQR